MEWLVGKGELAFAVELGDADRKLVQHGALRFAECPEFARLLFHLLDIHGVSRNALASEWEIGDAQRPARTINRSGDDALDRSTALRRLTSELRRSHAADRFDQLDLGFDHRIGSRCAHRLDIGRIDQAQLVVRPTEPHRHRRRFDQSDERPKILARTDSFVPQAPQLLFGFSEVEHPNQCCTNW